MSGQNSCNIGSTKPVKGMFGDDSEARIREHVMFLRGFFCVFSILGDGDLSILDPFTDLACVHDVNWPSGAQDNVRRWVYAFRCTQNHELSLIHI